MRKYKQVDLDLEWLKTVKELPSRRGSHFEYNEQVLERMNNNQCPSCGKPKDEWTRRRDWTCCSKECTAKHWSTAGVFRSVPSPQMRDNRTCVKCGWNEKDFSKLSFDERCTPGAWRSLEDDHIRPIALGGDEFDLDNMQTLCSECHKIKTKHDVQQWNKARRLLIKWASEDLLARKESDSIDET